MAEIMDRALKERTVGAVVLVVLAVLVVPVFLDGSAEDAEVVSESVTLPGQNGQPRRQQTIVLDRDRSEPVPAASDTADAPDAGANGQSTDDEPALSDALEPPAPTSVAPAREPAAAAPQVPPASAGTEGTKAPPATPEQSSTGMWAVQLGSFSKSGNAERLAANLRDEGYAAFLSRLEGTDGPLHRVRVGPQKDRDSAEEIAARLAADGHKGQVVPHP